MALKDIVNFVRAEAGIPYTLQHEKDYLHSRINSAADELYTNNDVPRCLKEVFIAVQPNASEIFTLPSYVGQVRACRRPRQNYASGVSISGPVDRYQFYTWGGVAVDNFRIVGESPTLRNIELQQNIVIKISRALAEDVTINLIGNTFVDTNVLTKVVIKAGTVYTIFSSPYLEFTSIRKAEYFDARVSGYEESIPSDPLFEIPTEQDFARNIKIQVRDLLVAVNYDHEIGWEMLYKPKFIPFRSVDHEFIVPDIYDRAIGFYCLGQYSKKKEEAQLYYEKAASQLNRINEDEARGRKQHFSAAYSKHAATYDRVLR